MHPLQWLQQRLRAVKGWLLLRMSVPDSLEKLPLVMIAYSILGDMKF